MAQSKVRELSNEKHVSFAGFPIKNWMKLSIGFPWKMVMFHAFRVNSWFSGWWFEPLWNIWKSIGMTTFPIYGKITVMFQSTHQFSMVFCMWKAADTPSSSSYIRRPIWDRNSQRPDHSKAAPGAGLVSLSPKELDTNIGILMENP